MKTVMLYL